MNEIDISKYFKLFDDGCYYFISEMNDELYEDIVDNNEQLQQLKAENEEIRKVNNANAKLMIRLRDCLNEIEEIAKDFHLSMIIFHRGTTHKMADIIDDYLDKISQLIKQAKEGE